MMEGLQAQGVLCEKRSLDIGDFAWIARSKLDPAQEVVLNCIVERKKRSDFEQSIKDARYSEQRARLRRTGMSRIVYLVEGVSSRKKQGAGWGGGGMVGFGYGWGGVGGVEDCSLVESFDLL